MTAFSFPPAEERFWARVEPIESGCWNYNAARNRDGYTRILADGKRVGTHRYAYDLLVGPIPDGLVIDHLCRNPWCVNPDHLEPVTQRINVLRGTAPAAANARSTHCSNGHEFSATNTYMNGNHRQCRICTYNSHRRAIDRRRQEIAA